MSILLILQSLANNDDEDGMYTQPKGTMPRIENIWAFVAVDPKDKNEGILAAPYGRDGEMLPLLAVDEERLKQMTGIVDEMLVVFPDMKVKLVKFSGREEIKEFSFKEVDNEEPPPAV